MDARKNARIVLDYGPEETGLWGPGCVEFFDCATGRTLFILPRWLAWSSRLLWEAWNTARVLFPVRS